MKTLETKILSKIAEIKAYPYQDAGSEVALKILNNLISKVKIEKKLIEIEIKDNRIFIKNNILNSAVSFPKENKAIFTLNSDFIMSISGEGNWIEQ